MTLPTLILAGRFELLTYLTWLNYRSWVGESKESFSDPDSGLFAGLTLPKYQIHVNESGACHPPLFFRGPGFGFFLHLITESLLEHCGSFYAPGQQICTDATSPGRWVNS